MAFACTGPIASAQPIAPTLQECRDFPIFPPEKSLPGGLARQIYSRLGHSFKFDQNTNDWKPCDLYYSELANHLGLNEELDLSRAKDQLKSANEMLLHDFYIKGYRWFEPSELSAEDRKLGRWQIRYWPGERFTHNQMMELWYESISPNNSDVTTVFNNRSVHFQKDRAHEKDRALAEPILEKGLSCARELGSPSDIIASLLNLGCFEYLGDNASRADRYFREAVALARSTTSPGSPALAPLVDFEAITARAVEDFGRAEKLYAEGLQIRTSLDGYYKPHVAHSLMNLACLYQDWSYKEEDPSLSRKYQKRAQDLFLRADEIINPPNDVKAYEELRDEAARNHDLAMSANSEVAWKYRRRARELSDQADKMQANLVFVNASNLSHGLGRPVHTALTVNPGSQKLAEMVNFARSITHKCDIKPREEDDEVGLATILGNWSIPTDVVEKTVKKTMKRTEQVHEGKLDVEETREEKVSPIENVPIYLCKYPPSPNSILAQIESYGARIGLSKSTLGDSGAIYGWPANHMQAEEVKQMIDQSAMSIAKRTTTTDKNGDYRFDSVPKGDYMLYASVCTKKHFLIWLIPKPQLRVRFVRQYRFDFTEKTGVPIWEDLRNQFPIVDPEHFRGTKSGEKLYHPNEYQN